MIALTKRKVYGTEVKALKSAKNVCSNNNILEENNSEGIVVTNDTYVVLAIT